MTLAGLTGGIASGKSAVAQRLAARGAVIIDADVLAREVVAPGTPGLAAVVERFSPAVLNAEGGLDRARLGEIVFADASARRDLEAIVHPLVRAEAARLSEEARADRPDVVVVQVIPLLVETGQAAAFECCVVVDVEPAVQLARLRARSGLSARAARARIAAQASRADRLAAATWVVDNNGTPDDLDQQVVRLWNHLHDHHAHQEHRA